MKKAEPRDALKGSRGKRRPARTSMAASHDEVEQLDSVHHKMSSECFCKSTFVINGRASNNVYNKAQKIHNTYFYGIKTTTTTLKSPIS